MLNSLPKNGNYWNNIRGCDGCGRTRPVFSRAGGSGNASPAPKVDAVRDAPAEVLPTAVPDVDADEENENSEAVEADTETDGAVPAVHEYLGCRGDF